jgi:hypothetical protein
MALSPLTTLGAIYQLIGQVGGLALLTAAITLIFRTRPVKPLTRVISSNVLPTIVLGAIFVWYPEVIPFFGLAWLLFVALIALRSKQDVIKVVLPALVIGLFVLVALNKYVVAALLFMLTQASGGMKVADMSGVLFPYFLIPSGFASLWGLMPIAATAREPYLSLVIAWGLLLFYWLLRHVVPAQVRKPSGPLSMLLIMTGMGTLLFFRNNDFGLFKLAMFLQPFLMTVVAVGITSITRQKRLSLIIVAGIFTTIIPIAISQYIYVGRSAGQSSSSMIEVPYASILRVNKQFKELIEKIDSVKNENIILISDTSNVVLAKFQALYSQSISNIFPARAFFKNIFLFGKSDEQRRMAEIARQTKTTSLFKNEFEAIKSNLIISNNIVYIYPAIKMDIFNSYSLSKNTPNRYYNFNKIVTNRLIFVHSKLGNHYYLGDRKAISFYQLENDPMFPGQLFSSLGRHFLFAAVNPTPIPRIMMELSATVVKQFGSVLPTPTVQETNLEFVGRGSGRIYSKRIEPTIIDNIPYLSIDIGRDGKQFPSHTTGLMLLYGRDIPRDQRRVTAFGRDISLISEDQYQALKSPESLNKFPSDLADKNLEYSGIYEDGWISERAFFMLTKNRSDQRLIIKGMVPQVTVPGFNSLLHISVDGQEVSAQKIGLGNFAIDLPEKLPLGKHRIDLAFDTYQVLPGEDGRIIGGKIDFLGFSADGLTQ